MTMMIKTAELKDRALDWAAGKASGLEIHISVSKKYGPAIFSETHGDFYSPSIDWAQGGPIIERELMEFDFECRDSFGRPIECAPTDTYRAKCQADEANMSTCAKGPTHLIAAMRCYVASKLGDEIEIPDEINQGLK